MHVRACVLGFSLSLELISFEVAVARGLGALLLFLAVLYLSVSRFGLLHGNFAFCIMFLCKV